MSHLQQFTIFLISVSVVILFFVSWAPFHFQRVGYVYFREHEYFRTVNQYLFYLSGFCYFLSSTLNPVLYTMMSAKYRAAFSTVLMCRTPESPGTKRALGVMVTLATSTTNLLSSSYVGVHLKGLLDSRRASRASNSLAPGDWEVPRPRSASLEPGPRLHQVGATTNLRRQQSSSEEGLVVIKVPQKVTSFSLLPQVKEESSTNSQL